MTTSELTDDSSSHIENQSLRASENALGRRSWTLSPHCLFDRRACVYDVIKKINNENATHGMLPFQLGITGIQRTGNIIGGPSTTANRQVEVGRFESIRIKLLIKQINGSRGGWTRRAACAGPLCYGGAREAFKATAGLYTLYAANVRTKHIFLLRTTRYSPSGAVTSGLLGDRIADGIILYDRDITEITDRTTIEVSSRCAHRSYGFDTTTIVVYATSHRVALTPFPSRGSRDRVHSRAGAEVAHAGRRGTLPPAGYIWRVTGRIRRTRCFFIILHNGRIVSDTYLQTKPQTALSYVEVGLGQGVETTGSHKLEPSTMRRRLRVNNTEDRRPNRYHTDPLPDRRLPTAAGANANTTRGIDGLIDGRAFRSTVRVV
ncbi:hypothetical protein EVAR_62094_1 [Eumeta japonica]|uniref:Uncharacterized protein n=1 Tax=Eumeta variegata TaxID=151549 RepID=A0A4C1Z1Y2_EUMVA|nr:hypothetical protein EVAR_62094_1 [Eumeta japonica]